MKLSMRQLRHIIREAMDSPLKAEKYAFNKMLTRVLQDINEESIPFGNDKEVVAAIDEVEAAMLKLQHAVFNSHQGQPLKESFGGRREKFEAWVDADDATDFEAGEVVMYCDPTGGQDELEFIISRLKELDALGGGVQKIHVTGFLNN